MVRKVIRDYVKETGDKNLLALMDLVKGNAGFCFTDGSIPDLRKEIMGRKVQCPAKAGAVAPVDVWVPAGPTGMEPTQTGFFQVFIFLFFCFFLFFFCIPKKVKKLAKRVKQSNQKKQT